MAESKRPSDIADKMLVRLPDGMRGEIAKAAERNGRSMNAEVVARLQESFERPDVRQEADYWREEFETLRENAQKFEQTLDEFRRDRTIANDWLVQAFNAQAAGKDPPPFPLSIPSEEIELRNARQEPRGGS